MTLDEFCNDIEAKIAGKTGMELLEQIVAGFCQAFTVKPDEVAVFMLDPNMEVLEFVWPTKLKKTGNIPLSSHNSLVARTANDKKASLNNSFASTPHASIFEFVKLDKEMLYVPHAIQKIMSSPIIKDEVVTGVIQISRKGENPVSAGKDFTSSELAALNRICQAVAGHLTRESLQTTN